MQNSTEILAFAEKKLNHILRKCGETCYEHALEVAKISKAIAEEMCLKFDWLEKKTDLIFFAGLLHDTIEDSGTTYDEIQKLTNPEVANWVAVLSEDKRLPKNVRLVIYNSAIKNACLEIQIVRLADIYANLRSLSWIDNIGWTISFKKNMETVLYSLSAELMKNEHFQKCVNMLL